MAHTAAVQHHRLAPYLRFGADDLAPSAPRRSWRLPWPTRRRARRAENAELIKRLERAVLGASDGLWEWEFATGRVWIMPQLAALLGGTVEQLPTHIDQWWDEIHADDLAGVQEALYRHRDFGDPYERQFRFRTRDGGYRWFRARGTAYRDAAGRALVMAGSICDVDDLFRTQEALRERDAELLDRQKADSLGSLAGEVAHEFNNLLQSIRGYASFARDAAANDQQRDDLNQVLAECDRAAKFTRQLLDFSRRGAAEPTRCPCDELLENLQALLRPLVPARIHLTVEQCAGDRAVRASERLLQQSLVNLCINACDAMPEGGRMVVRTERYYLTPPEAIDHAPAAPGDYVRFVVSDTGAGVAPEAADKLFQPFFTTKEHGGGAGLGLSTAAAIVSQCGGWMDFSSTLGEGATFFIYLPVEAAADDLHGGAAATTPKPLEATVLLAEDDPAAADVGRRMLERAGCRVLVATTGDEALTLFHERLFEIDAVVLDLALPGKSGLEVLAEVRHQAPELPACICTGYDPAAPQLDDARACGCGIIEKPFDEQRLVGFVRAAVAGAGRALLANW